MGLDYAEPAVAGTRITVATPSRTGIAQEVRMPPRYESHRVYLHWFTVAPALLSTALQLTNIPEHMRDLVLRRGPEDVARGRMNEAFDNAMAYVSDPRLRDPGMFPGVSD